MLFIQDGREVETSNRMWLGHYCALCSVLCAVRFVLLASYGVVSPTLQNVRRNTETSVKDPSGRPAPPNHQSGCLEDR